MNHLDLAHHHNNLKNLNYLLLSIAGGLLPPTAPLRAPETVLLSDAFTLMILAGGLVLADLVDLASDGGVDAMVVTSFLLL